MVLEFCPVNGDGAVSIANAVIAMKKVCGVDIVGKDIELNGDINGDNRIGMAEAVYILQKIAIIR